MPNPIYITPKANPWEAMLPQLLGNLFLAKIKHGWDVESSAEENYQKALVSGKFSAEPTEAAKPIGLSENPMYEQQKPTATINGRPLYRIETTLREGQVLGRDALIQKGPEGTKVDFAPAREKPQQGTVVKIMDPTTQKEVVYNMLRDDTGTINLTPIGEAKGDTSKGALTDRALRGDKQAEAILKRMQADEVEIAGTKARATEAAKTAEGFTTWTPEAQKQAFITNAITKDVPVSVKGLGGNDRKAYAKAYGQWQVDTGLSPQDISLMQADYRAGDVSLKNMTKQEAPMAAFVGNINKQITKVQQLYDNNDRTGIRLIDLPIRELKMRAKGSGEEAVKSSYLLEISNEIGKLSSGASASVQQLSDSAKEDWKKVHDPNLSFKEIMRVVNATRDQANMRISSWREAKEVVRGQIRGIGGNVPPTEPTATPSPIKLDADALIKKYSR